MDRLTGLYWKAGLAFGRLEQLLLVRVAVLDYFGEAHNGLGSLSSLIRLS